MTNILSQDELQENGRKGQEIYETQIRAQVDVPENRGKFLVINALTGEWELDDKDVVVLKRAQARFGAAPCLLLRVGSEAAYNVGGRLKVGAAP